jgi:hypothetical protein
VFAVFSVVVVQAQQVRQHRRIHPLPIGGERMIPREELAGAGVGVTGLFRNCPVRRFRHPRVEWVPWPNPNLIA